MAYGTKYRFTFESTNGATYRILIQKDGYSGSILDRCMGRAPVLKRKRSGRVHGTSLEIYAECKVDGEFSELYTSSATEFRVRLYKENTLKWSGFVSPELYSESDIAPPYDVQIVATDGLGELKLHTFEPQGSETLSALFAYLLLFTGRSIGRAYKTELSGLDSSGNAVSVSDLLGTATIDIDYMAGENCYDVLQYLLTTLCASITYYNTSWMIWRDNDATASNMGYQSVTNMGGGGLWPVGNLSTKIEPAKNQVTVEAPFHVWSPLVNPDMDRDSGWSKNSYVTYDAIRQGYKFYCPESYSSAYDVEGKLSQSVANLTILQDLILSFSLGNVYTDGELDVNISFSVNGLVNLNLYWDYNNNVLVWATSAPSGATRMYYNVADGGETITIPKIPSTLSSYQVAGTLKIEFSYIPRAYSFGQFGYEFYIYSAFLTRSISKGYRDILKIDNSARGEGETVEIAQGRLLANMVGTYYGYLRGVFCLPGKFVTGFKDSNFTSYTDFLALTARNYARLVALPRLRITGTLDTPASLSEPPMILRKGAVDYLLETCSWDLLNDELEIDALSLPSATLQVDSETVIDTTGESASSGGSSGGGGGGGGGGGTGTVTSVDMTVPTGFTIGGNPITDAGTLALGFTTGYSLPLTADVNKGVTAYGWGNHAQAGYLTGITSTMVINALGYTPQAYISDLDIIRTRANRGNEAYGWGNHANAGYAYQDDLDDLAEVVANLGSPYFIITPQLTIGSRWKPLSGGGAKFGTYLLVNHPKLGTAGYEWILMRRSKRGRKKSDFNDPSFDIRRSGWSEAIGQGDNESSYNWDPLTGTTKYVDLDTLRDFIMRRFVCTYDWQLSNWRNSAYLLDILKDPRAIDPADRDYTEIRFGQTFPMGSGGSHSVTREKWRTMTRTIAQFGIAIRRVNPEFLDHYNPQQTLAKTTRQISYLDGAVRKTVDRYLYSEVVPLRCFINIGELAGSNDRTWHLGFRLQDI